MENFAVGKSNIALEKELNKDNPSKEGLESVKNIQETDAAVSMTYTLCHVMHASDPSCRLQP